MMSSEYINYLADEAAKRARRGHKEPLVFESINDVDRHWHEIPNLGSYRPKGWELAEYRTVDKYDIDNSGAAMTHGAVQEWMKDSLGDMRTSGFATIEEGAFQIVIGRFERVRGRVAA